MKYGFIYIWRDRKHKRYYIGAHWGSEDDGYICSSSWMKRAYKIRPQDFKRRILARIYTTKQDMFEEESRWFSLIKKEELRGIKYYNLNISWKHWSSDEHKEKTIKEKISIKTKEAMQNPEVRENYLNGLETRNNRSSELEVREKRRQSMIKTMSEKFPEENRRKKLSDEERSQYYSDKAKSIWNNRTEEQRLETVSKISAGLKGKQNRLGQKNTPEHTAKIAEANRKRAKDKMESYRQLIEQTLHMKAIEASKIVGVGRQIITKYRKELLYK